MMKKRAAGFLFMYLIISCLFMTISAGYGVGGGHGGGGSSSRGGGGSSSSRGSSGSSSSRGSSVSGGRSSSGGGKGGGGGRSYSPGYYGYTPYYGSSPTTRRNCRTNNTRCNAAVSIMINKHKGTGAFPVFVTLATAIALVM